MKKLALSLAAIASVAAAAPTIAQAQMKFPWGVGTSAYNRGYGVATINDREQRIAFQINRGERNGELTIGEARSLRIQLQQIERLEARYAWNGFSRAEYIDLSQRLNRLEGNVQVAMNDYDRGDRYGWGYGYGR
jgi:hypothetical protein